MRLEADIPVPRHRRFNVADQKDRGGLAQLRTAANPLSCALRTWRRETIPLVRVGKYARKTDALKGTILRTFLNEFGSSMPQAELNITKRTILPQ